MNIIKKCYALLAATTGLLTTASAQFVKNEVVLEFVKTIDTAEFRSVAEKYSFRVFPDERNHFLVADGDSILFKKPYKIDFKSKEELLLVFFSNTYLNHVKLIDFLREVDPKERISYNGKRLKFREKTHCKYSTAKCELFIYKKKFTQSGPAMIVN